MKTQTEVESTATGRHFSTVRVSESRVRFLSRSAVFIVSVPPTGNVSCSSWNLDFQLASCWGQETWFMALSQTSHDGLATLHHLSARTTGISSFNVTYYHHDVVWLNGVDSLVCSEWSCFLKLSVSVPPHKVNTELITSLRVANFKHFPWPIVEHLNKR